MMMADDDDDIEDEDLEDEAEARAIAESRHMFAASSSSSQQQLRRSPYLSSSTSGSGAAFRGNSSNEVDMATFSPQPSSSGLNSGKKAGFSLLFLLFIYFFGRKFLEMLWDGSLFYFLE